MRTPVPPDENPRRGMLAFLLLTAFIVVGIALSG
jgi:hypothetical protein